MKKNKKSTIVDLLVTLAFFLIIGTTLVLNIYIGLYLLALVLLGLAIIISRYR